MGYAKLFSAITKSSLWSESKDVRLLFVSMLAEADEQGFVEAAIPGLARLSNLTVAEVNAAIEVLTAPDPHSKDQANEGRRIARVDGGWRLLNYAKYKSRQEDVAAHEQRARDSRDMKALGSFTSNSLAFITAFACFPQKGRTRRLAASVAWNQAVIHLSPRFDGSPARAEDWLTQRIRAFAKSPKGTGSFCCSMVSFLEDGRYDDADEAWDKSSTAKEADERQSRYQELPPIQ